MGEHGLVDDGGVNRGFSMAASFLLFRIVVAVALVLAPAAAFATSPPVDAAAVQAALSGDGELRLGGRTLDRDTLTAIYQKREFQPIWDDARRASLQQAFDEALSQGLDAAAYAVPEGEPVEREVLTTDAFLRFALALGKGRIAPTDLETDWMVPAPAFDAAKTLDRALAGNIHDVLAALVPDDPGYQRLRDALQHYRDLANGKAWGQMTLPIPLKRGDSGPDVRALRSRLAAEDYLADEDREDFDETLETALKQFQERRGLVVDGAIGRGTLAALNVTPAMLVRQIRLNLERWRSLPRGFGATRVEVNIPAATATLFEDGTPVLSMRAIVGAVAHPSPVLRARMLSVLFNPPWNVPSSIIVKEIRPALRRDPHYLTKNNYVYVERGGGQILQQLPGPKNALGQIKFEMPNPDDIYLHDTPTRSLFQKARRAISHGCIRVEDPRGLASRVLAPLPDAAPEAIEAAIATGETQSVNLPHSIPVYLIYATAFVDADGTVEFRDDVYGRDKRLAAALATYDAGQGLATVKAMAGKG